MANTISSDEAVFGHSMSTGPSLVSEGVAGLFKSLVGRLSQAHQRRLDNEVGHFIEEHGGQLTDDLERQISLASARSEARAIVLRAQQTVVADATTAAHTAAQRLVSAPRYALLVDRLATEARERLAGGGPVEIRSAPGGGIVARAGSREIDYSLDAQVDRCLAALAGEIDRLWQ